MVLLVTKWFGSFLVEGGRVTQEARFPLEAREIAKRLQGVRTGKILDEEKSLAKGAAVEVLEARLRPLGKVHEKAVFFDLQVDEPDRRLLHDAAIHVAREESREAAGERDRFLSQAVNAMDELDKTINTLVERVREWYGLHFPESLDKLTDPKTFVELLARNPDRESVRHHVDASKSAADSIGVDFAKDELGAIQGFAKNLRDMFAERNRIEKLVTDVATEVAPNLSLLVGGLIAAKLIARAGSLESLAFCPASTIQTLGAETSLFQHLKDGTKPPKHGILFQHGLVNTAPKWQRGRMSRMLSGYCMIASRFDHFDKKLSPNIDALKAKLETNVQRIKTSKPRERPQQRPEGKLPPWKIRKMEGQGPPPRRGGGPGGFRPRPRHQ
ncbi:MAG TPA: NOP5/NOP56 family protein, partial [Candidatus Thermoplasmatota archaeon]